MPPLGALVGALQNLLTIAFWALIAADHAGHISVIDPEYKETGFCAATLETHAFDSYQLCLVVDMLGCLALLALWRSGKETKATVGPAASIFFHGIFHGSQWFFGWPFPPLVELVVYPLFTLSFVGGFGVGFKVGTKLHLLAIATAIELFRMTFVADPFAFAYANTWIYAVGTGVAIAQGVTQRKKPPAPSPFLFFGVIEPFCEAILCNKGFKSLGGHAIFDTTIVLNSIMMALASPQAAGSADKKLR